MLRRTAATGAATILGLSALFIAAPVAEAQQNTAGSTKARPKATPVTVAHRGASAYAPENTLAAIDKAEELGAQWVENDVQRTKDGQLVVIHDATLNRTTNVEEVFPDRAPWNVADFTLAEIEKLDAGSWFDAKYGGQRVPTLQQYLDKLDETGQDLLLEIKQPQLYPGIEDQISEELRSEGWLSPEHVADKLIVQSFSADSLKAFHAVQPDVTTGFLGTPPKGDLPEYAKFTDMINPTHADVSADYISAIHQFKGVHGETLKSYTWTVNDAATARTVRDAGVDGIITNTPDVVMNALKRG
jgi:glycerophosphoryl diester phosphodiesterase